MVAAQQLAETGPLESAARIFCENADAREHPEQSIQLSVELMLTRCLRCPV
jgi:hypothetical protein